MKKITIFVMSTIISSFALADFEIPNQFEDGQVTSASQMNENFQALKSEIEILRAQLEQNQASTKVQFQGFSEPFPASNASIDTFKQACHAVSPGSRICNSDEIVYADYDPENLLGDTSAWIINSTEPDKVCWQSGYGSIISYGRFTSTTTSCGSGMRGVACCK